MHVDADSLGNYLRRERELQHISLQDISAATKIQLRFLADLENDAYDQLPPAPFVVGFLRAYAQCLALDPEEIVAIYHAHYGRPDELERQRFAEHVQPARRPSRRLAWKRLSLILVMTTLALAFLWRFARDRQDITVMSPVTPKVVEQAAEAPAPLSASSQPRLSAHTPQVQMTGASPGHVSKAVPAPGAPVQIAPTREPTVSLQDNVPMAAVPAAEPAVASLASEDGAGQLASESGSERPVPETLQSATSPSIPHHSPALSSSSLMLQVMALEDTWLRVEIDGEQRHTLLLVAGKNIEWEADERFMLTVGNAHGTRLVLNGRGVPLPVTRNNVVRDFILTRNMVN